MRKMDQPFKIIVTTSDGYHHVLPIFFFLFNKFWGEETQVELVGYKKPDIQIPENFTFVSLGEQHKHVGSWSTKIREYFSEQPDYFIWMMEDTFIYRPVKHESIEFCKEVVQDKRIGRIALSDYSYDQYTCKYSQNVCRTGELSKYNLSTQIALWNKDYLLRYLRKEMSPWELECQRKHIDGFHNVCLVSGSAPVTHNEGVRIRDIHKFNFSGFDQSLLNELKQKFGV